MLLLVILTSVVTAELPWTYPPGDLSQESRELLEEAGNFHERGALDRAKERYLTIAAEYAGTGIEAGILLACLLYTSPSPRDRTRSRMPSSA